MSKSEMKTLSAPKEAYDRAMRHGSFYHAASIAQTYGLGRSLEVQAAFMAYCRFDDLHMDDDAFGVIIRFKLTLIVSDRAEILRLMQALGALPPEIHPGSFLNEPTYIQ